jgi:N-formylglutamate amidohydrolase
MSEVGMGAIYTKTSSGTPLRNISLEKKEQMLSIYYDPYHKNLTEKVQEKINLYGNCIIIDAHSFPSKALLYETDKTLNRPDICIGYEEFHISSELLNSAKNFFSITEGLNVSENEPFTGSIVPNDFYMKDKRVTSIMIELNRALYMDEVTGEKLPQFESIKKIIAKFLDLFIVNI